MCQDDAVLRICLIICNILANRVAEAETFSIIFLLARL